MYLTVQDFIVAKAYICMVYSGNHQSVLTLLYADTKSEAICVVKEMAKELNIEYRENQSWE